MRRRTIIVRKCVITETKFTAAEYNRANKLTGDKLKTVADLKAILAAGGEATAKSFLGKAAINPVTTTTVYEFAQDTVEGTPAFEKL